MSTVLSSMFTVLCASIFSVAAIEADEVLLTRTPMIMAHDAATGYLGRGLVNSWAKTQSKPFASQLECGARAFDARPKLDSRRGLIWHHGAVGIEHQLSESLSEIIGWCNENPSELVVLPFSDCGGDGCVGALASALASANITNLDNCTHLHGLTYGAAKTMAVLPGGGALLALTGSTHPNGAACSFGNYDSSQSCRTLRRASGRLRAQLIALKVSTLPFDCWSGRQSTPVDRMLAYLDEVSAGGLRDNAFTQFQALWQESAGNVAIGTSRFSSLLKDETRSGLNAIITAEVLRGRWPAINMLEVNNVCDGGLELLAALRNVQVAGPAERIS